MHEKTDGVLFELGAACIQCHTGVFVGARGYYVIFFKAINGCSVIGGHHHIYYDDVH